MATVDDVLNQVSDLLDRLNRSEAKNSLIGAFLKNPIAITVIGSIMVTVGSNWVTKQFQLRDKQSDAVAALESEIPRELAVTTHLAMVLSVLEEQKCDENPDKVLSTPFVLGLTGKSCKDAEAEYLKYFSMLLEKPPGSSLVKVRALFASPAVDDGAQKLGALVGVLSVTSKPSCIVQVSRQARAAYDELVNLTIKEIDGTKVVKTPEAFNLSGLINLCGEEDLCRAPGLPKDLSSKLKCS